MDDGEKKNDGIKSRLLTCQLTEYCMTNKLGTLSLLTAFIMAS